MPSLGALAICTLFVALLVGLTTRSSEGKAFSVWIPTLWLFVCSSRSVGRWFSGGSVFDAEVSETGGSLYDQVVLGGLIVLALLVLLNRRVNWAKVLRDNRWAYALLLYVGASIVWSHYPIVSLKRYVKALGTVLCAMVILSEPDPREAIRVVIRRTAYVLVPFSLVLIKYFPLLGISYGRWSGSRMAIGVCLQKNQLGALCMMSAIFLIWDHVRKGRPTRARKAETIADILILLMTFYLLKGADTNTYSATSIGALALGLCLIFVLSGFRSHPGVLGNVILIAAIGLAMLLIASRVAGDWSPVGALAKVLGRDETLTGRVDIWDSVFEIVPRWSVLGTGYGGFWGLPYSYAPIGEMSGHNGYLDVYVEVGAVGVALLAVFLLSLFRRATTRATEDFDWCLLCLCYLLVSLVYNYSESDFLSTGGSPLWSVVLFMSYSLSSENPASTEARSNGMRSIGDVAVEELAGAPAAGTKGHHA